MMAGEMLVGSKRGLQRGSTGSGRESGVDDRTPSSLHSRTLVAAPWKNAG